ncbi:MAG: tetratricopeptide repeat protein, partial [Cyanobium sp.]
SRQARGRASARERPPAAPSRARLRRRWILGQPGDLSELGILSGDSYLEISQRPAADVVERICERLALQGVMVPRELPQQPGGELAAEEERTPSRWRRWFSGPHRRRNQTLLGAAGGLSLALALPLAWRLSSGWLAQAQLAAGDRAFGDFDKAFEPSEQDRHLQRAEAAWRQAAQLAPNTPEPQARLGFLYDLRGELPQAKAAYERARDLEPSTTTAARGYRIGLAAVLSQLPGGQHQALEAFQADPNHPRAAVELAMLRWGDPAALPEARDAVNKSELERSLRESGAPAPGWSFPVDGGRNLLMLHSPRQQRCLLAAVRATTLNLLGKQLPSPLAAEVCRGESEKIKTLLCTRLQQAAATTHRAPLTARWLSCPASAPAAASPPRASGTVSYAPALADASPEEARRRIVAPHQQEARLDLPAAGGFCRLPGGRQPSLLLRVGHPCRGLAPMAVVRLLQNPIRQQPGIRGPRSFHSLPSADHSIIRSV